MEGTQLMWGCPTGSITTSSINFSTIVLRLKGWWNSRGCTVKCLRTHLSFQSSPSSLPTFATAGLLVIALWRRIRRPRVGFIAIQLFRHDYFLPNLLVLGFHKANPTQTVYWPDLRQRSRWIVHPGDPKNQKTRTLEQAKQAALRKQIRVPRNERIHRRHFRS